VNVLNEKIVSLAVQKEGKKVLRGECWDLAKYVLDENNCKWDGLYNYGEELSKSACVMPGDIIQFKNVKLKYERNGQTFNEVMTHHTAIISQVNGEGDYIILHQNTGQFGRKVGRSIFRTSEMIKGSIKIYRPVSN
jgi:signal peptidase I